MAIARPGKTAKLADVARAAGVSPGTVSNVFNRPAVVRDEVQRRVRAVASELGYSPDPAGRLLRAGKVNAIGVATIEPLSYFFADPFARMLMTGITQACQANGAGVSLVSAANVEELAWNVRNALVDGFILFCLEGSHRLIRSAVERHLPFVAVGVTQEGEDISTVGVDDVAGARVAARHLAGFGHRRFAVLTMDLSEGSAGRATLNKVERSIYSTSRERVQGYFEVLSGYGIDTAAVPIFETQKEESTVWAALEELFADPTPPTAILAESDRIALIALDWLNTHGLAVPGDVSIIGFDDVPESAASTPPLTTVAQPIVEMGRRAADMILAFDGTISRQVLDVSLIVRGTTAPPPSP
jgi:DNA-binding LacI/PurR family transcriptional regulator